MTTDAPRHGHKRARPQLGRATWQRTRKQILQRDAWTCRYCGAEATVVDHVVPPERYVGAHDDPDNLVAACVSCNNSKRGMSLENWYRAAGKPLPSWWLSRTHSGGDGGHTFAYHHHPTAGVLGVQLVGNMGIPWSGDGCPPSCSLPR